MGRVHPLDRSLSDGFPHFSGDEHLRAFERELPYEQRVEAASTYEALCKGAAVDPDKPAIHFLHSGEVDERPQTISYQHFLGRIHQTANLFHSLGVGPEDVVSFLLPLLPQSHFVLWGAEAAGIANPVNPLLEPAQIAEILKAAGTRMLVTLGPQPGVEIWEKALAVRKLVPGLERVLQVLGPGDETEGVLSYDALVEQQPADRLVSGRHIASTDTAAYFHTGGTTGMPKLARHTHGNQVYQAWAVGVGLETGPESVLMTGLPLFHVGGAFNQGLCLFAAGGTAVMLTPGGFRNPTVVRNYWRLAEKYRATSVSCVPTVFSGMLQAPSEGLDLGSIEWAGAGGSAIPVEVGRAMEEKIGVRVLEVYGMTETSSILTTMFKGDRPRLGSVGLPFPYSRVRTVRLDEEGRYARDCEPEEIGVVAMSGPGVFSGYVQDHYNRNAFIEPGWVNSGDLGRIDREGYLWITGRAKDVILRGGHNIDPQVIEEVLYQHPAVSLAAAVGKPDAYAGELPVAYVQLKTDVSATPEEILSFARERIPERAAFPADLFLLDEMPLTLVGKVYKPALRHDAAGRVFEALIDLGQLGIAHTVEVAPHPVHGTLVTVTLRGGDPSKRANAEQVVQAVFAPFTTRHSVTWD